MSRGRIRDLRAGQNPLSHSVHIYGAGMGRGPQGEPSSGLGRLWVLVKFTPVCSACTASITLPRASLSSSPACTGVLCTPLTAALPKPSCSRGGAGSSQLWGRTGASPAAPSASLGSCRFPCTNPISPCRFL